MHLTPPPTGASRAVQHPMGRGVGAFEASRDMETGQVASRAVPVLGPKVEQGAWPAMTEQGDRAAMADPGTSWAMADQGTLWAMVDQGTTWAMAGSPPPPPQQKKKTFYWGDSSTGGTRKHGHLGALGRARTPGGRSGGAYSRGALWRSGL